ncbi:photosystem II assembly protein Psb34 [Leptolyngbya sp. FACHB-261]|uniref:photosystem II assembly protein Psb34 n=1 Tax=Leptolyngbya sp. FACHB-261 TaxID=2692806 RepID=UPI0016875505|nr:ssl1498 family light-harvesting-like protein [Leptolyngbya sp. FACHB-261]MBD2103661.1 ssl1498 family light-harvesting-like protein [Leptolyngbya sp. FACHB-261]
MSGYTQDERGILNNYATEPVMYLADSPSSEQQRFYVFQGVAASALVGLLILTALSVSTVG